MQKVYGTLATGIGIAAGASLFTMATPLVGMHPLIPGLAAMVPLMGIMYTSKHTHSTALRAGLFAAFTGLSGVSMAPLLLFALKISPALVPQARARPPTRRVRAHTPPRSRRRRCDRRARAISGMREPHTQPNNPVLRRIARGSRARARTAARDLTFHARARRRRRC